MSKANADTLFFFSSASSRVTLNRKLSWNLFESIDLGANENQRLTMSKANADTLFFLVKIVILPSTENYLEIYLSRSTGVMVAHVRF